MDLEDGPDIQPEPDINNVCCYDLDNSTSVEPQLGSNGSSVVAEPQGAQNDNVAQNCSGMELTTVDEPYVGQEFVSEEAAIAFYNAYSMRVGFVTRMNYHNRSKHDGSVISRTIVCNKEGFRKHYRRSKNVRERVPTRVGCDALISIRKMSTGKWIVTRFVKEHNHSLTGGLGIMVYNTNPEEDKRVQELTKQLLIERKRSASLRKFIDLLFSHIEEHTQDLSKKIQYIVDNVNKIESEGKSNQKCR